MSRVVKFFGRKSSNEVPQCMPTLCLQCGWCSYFLNKYPEQSLRLNSRQQNNGKSEFDDSEDLVPLSAIVFGWEDQSTAVRSHNTQSGPSGIKALRLGSRLDLYQGDNTKGLLQ